MTDRTQPDSASTTGSTHIIRYALELGLLWIDGDGRDKVREALNALDALEAKLASIGAGGVQALSAAPAEADMFWDAEDGERFGHDIDDIISDFGPGDRVKIDCAKRMPSIEVLVIEDGDDFTYQVISPTPPAEQQVIIDFAQVGTAGPFHVVNGRVKLPDATMQDLARMLRPTYEAEQAAPKAAAAKAADSAPEDAARWNAWASGIVEACNSDEQEPAFLVALNKAIGDAEPPVTLELLNAWTDAARKQGANHD